MRHLTIAIDFDGTIVENRWPEIGPIIPGAADGIVNLFTDGHYLILNTCRKGDRLKEAVAFLKSRQLYSLFECVNKNRPALIERYGGDCRKIFADVYVDDRNVHPLPPWKEVVRLVRVKAAEGVTL